MDVFFCANMKFCRDIPQIPVNISDKNRITFYGTTIDQHHLIKSERLNKTVCH